MFTKLYDHTLRPQDRASIPGFEHLDLAQRSWEITQLLNTFIQRKPMNILEVGTWQGGTLYGWLKWAQPGAFVLTVDENEARPEWKAWQREDVKHVHLVGNSQVYATILKVQELMPEVDFLFIDADHTYGGVCKDFNSYGPLVKDGGLIALHDIIKPAAHRNQGHIQVYRLWKEIQRAGYPTQELVCSPKEEWGGIGVVFR